MALNWRKSVIAKKARRYGFLPLRLLLRYVESNNGEKENPPVIANSFPKSGTNLLVQILQELPELRDWGLFLALTPSFTFQEIPGNTMAKKIRRIANRELVGAHLFYSPEVKQSLSDRGVAHYFIYRDPRDVVISEAHYLHKMNRWHALSKYFRSLPDMQERINFSITGTGDPGFPYDFPNIKKRFERYKPWVYENDVYALRYEDLNSEKRDQVVKQMIQFYATKTKQELNQKECIRNALYNINPRNSPTFRKGKIGTWVNEFTEDQKKLFKDIAGDLLIELGYEKDYDW